MIYYSQKHYEVVRQLNRQERQRRIFEPIAFIVSLALALTGLGLIGSVLA